MSNWKYRFTCIVLLSCGAMAALTPSAVGNGKTPSLWLRSRLLLGERPCEFETTIDPILFSIATVAETYNVIRIKCDNRTRQKLVLSDKQDTATVIAGKKTVEAILDLATVDPNTWEAIPMVMRKQIVYPTSIDAGEENDLLLFLPAGKLSFFTEEGKLLGAVIELKLGSVDESLTLRDASRTKK